MSFLQKQDSTKHIVVTSASGGHRPIERKVIVTTPGQLEATRQVVHTEKLFYEHATDNLQIFILPKSFLCIFYLAIYLVVYLLINFDKTTEEGE